MDRRYPLPLGDEPVECAELRERDVPLAGLLHLAGGVPRRRAGAVVDLLERAVAEDPEDDEVVGALADPDGVHLRRLDLHQVVVGRRPVVDGADAVNSSMPYVSAASTSPMLPTMCPSSVKCLPG